MGIIFAYARVSTEGQDLDPQIDELRLDGFDKLVIEKASGANRYRPELAKLVREMNEGDILKVVRIDRLARSVSHLLEVVETLTKKNAHFRSLRDPIDTTTAQGMFSLQVLGAVAQLERALIADRCKAGIRSARARGTLFGNPGVRGGNPIAIAKIVQARDKTHVTRLINSMETFMPTVRQLRPRCPWPEVAEEVSRATGVSWTVERLKRSIRRLVTEGRANADLLTKAPRRGSSRKKEVAVLVRGIKLASPGISLRRICRHLEAMQIPTLTRKSAWSPALVVHVLKNSQPLGQAAS